MRAPLIAAALALAGCATTAEMAVPPELSGPSESLVITGVGAGRTGAFAAGPWSGDFTRSAERLAIFDPLFERRSGAVSFSLRGPQINGAIEAECTMREQASTVWIVMLETQPMVYSCAFRHEGQAIPARFAIAANHDGPATLKAGRRGEIALGRVIVQIRSVHSVAGSPLQTAAPIGYVFERDGRAIGALHLNGATRLTHETGLDGPSRRTLLVASVALVLSWDPSESALGREAG